MTNDPHGWNDKTVYDGKAAVVFVGARPRLLPLPW